MTHSEKVKKHNEKINSISDSILKLLEKQSYTDIEFILSIVNNQAKKNSKLKLSS